MDTSYFDRFKEIIFDERISTRGFELSIGKTNGYLNMMKKNTGSPAIDVIVKTMEVYPKYNLYWLATGKGEKFVNVALSGVNEDAVKYKKHGASIEVLENYLVELIKRETASKFKKLNESVLTLLLHNMSEAEKEVNKKKENTG